MTPATATATAPPPYAPEQPWGAVPGHSDVWPTPAQELLLRAALISDERALGAWRQVRSLVEVATLDHATQALLPVLRKNLLALGEQDELLSLFKGVHRYSWARNQMLLAPMIPIVQALERAGTPTLLLKGAAFVADSRLDAGMRPMNDVDVLVPYERRREAIDALLEAGLVPVGGTPAWYVADYAPRFVPSHGFRDELDRQLDLHWHVLHASCQRDADEDFWSAAISIELLGARTRALCPADELLLVVLHGLRWNAIPTYRWVVDAALLCGGEIGEIDYERLVAQARKRRVTVALRAGLDYLRRVVGAPVPAETIRALRPLRPALLERVELRAQMTQPRARSAIQREVVYHQQYARRELALGARSTLARNVALARRRLGIERLADLRGAFGGGTPGPGRPSSEVAAAIGRGEARPTPLGLGEPLDFGRAEVARDHTRYGTWLAEGGGCWTAGRRARLALRLREPASTSLALEIAADALLAGGCERQRLNVAVNGANVAAMTLVDANLHGGVLLPRELVAGCDTLDVVLETPDATSHVELGVGDDDRRVGVFLRTVTVRAPRSCELGETLLLGAGCGEESMLVGGWGRAELTGRWTIGPRALLLLRLDGCARPAELEFDATPFLGQPGRTLEVDVLVNGHLARTIDYDRASDEPMPMRATIPAASVEGACEEVVISWRIRDPPSPQSLGLSADRRALGLFVRRLVLR
ncbi:MAG TPA: nucleotidyltransferase family protein [Solirubrobacteraceae bacterium]|nr:nucleotidyltransferase family protein [Solirubrobacteraceae bacterium]